MPIWRNMPSMPKVRDSSGTIGTTRLPMCLSRSRMFSMRTKAIVVDISRPSPDALSSASKARQRRHLAAARLRAATLGR
jgi:hypothetical protein